MPEEVELEARLALQEEFEPSESFVCSANVSNSNLHYPFVENWHDCRTPVAETLDREKRRRNVLHY